MATLREMKGVKPRVEKLLLEYPHLRDDDNKLIANIWYNDLEVDEMSAKELLFHFSEGKLTSPESIRRMRAKLQEQCPEYRGENYKSRLNEEEKVRLALKKQEI